LTTGASTHTFGFVVVTVTTLTFLLVGWIIYRVALPHLIARLGN
jgi:hypothetical protein